MVNFLKELRIYSNVVWRKHVLKTLMLFTYNLKTIVAIMATLWSEQKYELLIDHILKMWKKKRTENRKKILFNLFNLLSASLFNQLQLLFPLTTSF